MRKMSYRVLPVLAVLAGLCLHCSSRHESQEKALHEESADYAPASVASADTTMAVPADTMPERQFVRTANLKFRVQDVAQTTHTVEDLTGKYGGFITQNHLSSSVVNSHSVQITADSLLETIEYRVENNLSLRVPNQNLDSLLRELSRQVLLMELIVVNSYVVILILIVN